jgi:hypothetical protein
MNIIFENQLIGLSGIEYLATGYEIVGPNGIHLFLESEENRSAIYLEANEMSVNDVECGSIGELITMIGNPPLIQNS